MKLPTLLQYRNYLKRVKRLSHDELKELSHDELKEWVDNMRIQTYVRILVIIQTIVGMDMACLILSFLPFSLDLSGLNLSGLDLSGLDLSFSICVGTNFYKACLDYALFSGSNLTRAIFKEATFHGVNFENSDLSYADFRFGKGYCTIINGEAVVTNFNRCVCDHTYFMHADIGDSSFKDTKCKHANFNHAKCGRVNFTGSFFYIVFFWGTRLSGATFDLTIIEESGFQYASLSGTTFNGARIEKVIFAGANLCFTDLSKATRKDSELWCAYTYKTKINPKHLVSKNKFSRFITMYYWYIRVRGWRGILHDICKMPLKNKLILAFQIIILVIDICKIINHPRSQQLILAFQDITLVTNIIKLIRYFQS